MDYHRAFPYYLGYNSGYNGGYSQGYGSGVWSVPEDRILEDLEYLQQMYPTYAKKYQKAISSAVDKMDYGNSFIYDQYPDKLALQRMAAGVLAVIKADEAADDAKQDAEGKALTEDAPWDEKEPWIRELVTVLMYYEIIKRRKHHSNGRGSGLDKTFI